MRILVTGAAGLLGSEVVAEARARGHEVLAADRAVLDVTDGEAAARLFADWRPGAVIHCAAWTAVDRAEEEPEEAMRVNRDGTAAVAAAASDAGAWLVAISTDYVFDGTGTVPYLPHDPTGPRSAYGRTKLEAERAALASDPCALVVRTSWLYGEGGRNFVSAMLERGARGEPLRVVDDQRGRPTWGRNAAAVTLDLLHRRARGVWHVADGGEATWLELAREAFRLAGLSVPLAPVSTADWGAPAPRPAYSVLDVGGTEALLGRRMQDWREALAAFLETRGETRGATGPETAAAGPERDR